MQILWGHDQDARLTFKRAGKPALSLISVANLERLDWVWEQRDPLGGYGSMRDKVFEMYFTSQTKITWFLTFSYIENWLYLILKC